MWRRWKKVGATDSTAFLLFLLPLLLTTTPPPTKLAAANSRPRPLKGRRADRQVENHTGSVWERKHWQEGRAYLKWNKQKKKQLMHRVSADWIEQRMKPFTSLTLILQILDILFLIFRLSVIVSLFLLCCRPGSDLMGVILSFKKNKKCVACDCYQSDSVWCHAVPNCLQTLLFLFIYYYYY